MSKQYGTQEEFKKALLTLDRVWAASILNSVIEEHDIYKSIEELIIPTLQNIGDEWEQGLVSLSQIYMCGRICEQLVDNILPNHSSVGKNQTRIAIATLEDSHALGKRIVYSVVRASGFDVIDYGHGIKAEELAVKAYQDKIRILLISTLMLPSALKVAKVRKKLDEFPCDIKIVVGGAPFIFDTDLWKKVGADAFGRSAPDAVKIINELIGENDENC